MNCGTHFTDDALDASVLCDQRLKRLPIGLSHLHGCFHIFRSCIGILEGLHQLVETRVCLADILVATTQKVVLLAASNHQKQSLDVWDKELLKRFFHQMSSITN